MKHDKTTIMASIVANGLRSSGRNKWTDGRCEWTIRKRGNGFILDCRYLVPVADWNAEIRHCLRPAFLAHKATA